MHNVVWHPAELRCWSGAALGKCMACNTWFYCMKISNYQITIGLFGKIFKNHVACFCAFTLDYQATKEQVGECSAKRLSWGQVFQFYETQTFFAEHPNLRFCPKKTLFLLEILFVSCMWLGASPRKQPVMGPVGHSRRSEGRKKGLWRKWTELTLAHHLGKRPVLVNVRRRYQIFARKTLKMSSCITARFVKNVSRLQWIILSSVKCNQTLFENLLCGPLQHPAGDCNMCSGRSVFRSTINWAFIPFAY